MKQPKVLLLNLLCIRCRNTSKMVAQSYSQGTEQLKICDACCINGRHGHGTNISNIKIFRDTFVFRYSRNVLAKFEENLSHLYAL